MINRGDVPPTRGPGHSERHSNLAGAVALLSLLVFAAMPCIAAPASLGVPMLVADGDDGSVPLEITSLEIRVTVRGHLSRTEYEVRFRNGGPRELRGEFLFPLPPGADVTDLALDVNGRLRHASSVEREVAKRAFEDVVYGQRRDPILAEWREGSGFRYEIFPIPPGGERTVLLAYDRELQLRDDGAAYELAIRSPETCPARFKIEVDGDDDSEIDVALPRRHERGTGVLASELSGEPLDAVVRVKQSPRVLEQLLVERSADDGLSYVSFPLQQPDRLPRHRPAMRVVVFWDASSSGRLQNRMVVSRYLAEFLARQAAQPRVDIVPFHLWLEDPIVLRDRSPAGIKRLLDEIPALGATDLARLLRELPQYVDERDFGTRVVVVTDGLHDAGTMRSALDEASRLDVDSAVIDVVTASPDSHLPILESIAAAGRGRLVNLNGVNPVDAADAAMNRTGEIGLVVTTGTLDDLTPGDKVPLAIEPFVVVCGRSQAVPDVVEIETELSGTERRQLFRRAKRDIAGANGLVRAAWARARLKSLISAPGGGRREEIIAIGRRFRLLTPHTSFIVLERWRDYVAHDIPMPDEVRAEMEVEQRGAELARPRAREDFVQRRDVRPGDWILNGIVLTEDSPLPGVTVLLDAVAIRLLTVSGIDGRFFFAHETRPPRFLLRAEMDGMSPVTRSYSEGMESGGEASLQMSMSAIAEAITVTAAAPAIKPPSLLPGRTGAATRVGTRGAPCAICDRLLDKIVKENGYEGVSRAEAEAELRPFVIDGVIAELQKASMAEGLRTYLEARERLGSSRRFVLTAASHFEARDRRIAVRVVTDLLEGDADDAPFLRLLAQVLIGMGEAELAEAVLKRALELAPDEPQSWRDAIVLAARLGHENRVATLRAGWNDKSAARTRDQRFPEVESRIAEELARWDALTSSQRRAGAEIEIVPGARIQGVLRWDSNYAYVDLHVTEPSTVKVYWQHEDGPDGGHIRGWLTEGYGPQVYWNGEPHAGQYDFAVEYWSQDTTEGDLETIAHLAVFKPGFLGKLVREDHIAVLYQDDDHISIAAIDVRSKEGRTKKAR